jgi:nucleoside triphosphatase
MKTWRIIVVSVIQNDAGAYLICKKPETRGVFPGQWALPGGGIEEGEHMLDALCREIREEVGVEVTDIQPLFFKDGEHPKLYPDGTVADVYMIFLNFLCRLASAEVHLGEEFIEYQWVEQSRLGEYDLNSETRDTFRRMGIL